MRKIKGLIDASPEGALRPLKALGRFFSDAGEALPCLLIKLSNEGEQVDGRGRPLSLELKLWDQTLIAGDCARAL